MKLATVLILGLFAPIYCLDVFKQSECGRTKSCLRWSSCDLPYCDLGFSWQAKMYNETDYLEFEIVGSLQNSTNGFIALGFSTDNKMFDNGVVACRMKDGDLHISAGHNTNFNNGLYNSSELDQNLFVTSDSTKYGVEFDSAHKMLRCRFLRLLIPDILGTQLKNLSTGNKYYLLSSKGIANSPSRLSYHYQNRRVSISSYDLILNNRVNGIITDNYRLVKVHACFMIIGWVLFATNGIFIAFFYKNNWPASSILAQRPWFQFHRLLQMSCIICVIIGFVVIFVNVGRYSSLGSLPYTAHPVLGIIATSLLLVNPIIALFRCNPESESRWIFNGLHFVVGTSAYIFAFSAMAIGIQLPPAGPVLSSLSWPYICVLVFIILIICVFSAEALKKIRQDRMDAPDENWSLNPNRKTRIAAYNIIIESLGLSIMFTVILLLVVLLN